MRPSFSIRQILADLPIPRKLGLIIGLFCSILFGLLVLSYFGLEVLSSVRAYVSAEGLWSRAQKQAVLRLGRYAWSHNETDYRDFLGSLNIPLGDQQARMEMDKPRLDEASAWRGFLQGGNHPKDIPGMIHLFRRYRRVSYIREANDIWSRGDPLIAQLQAAGDQIHRIMNSARPSPVLLEKVLIQVQEINAQLTPLENAFSATLGDGARKMQDVLIFGMALAALVLVAAALFIAILISRQLCGEIDQLCTGAARIAKGDYAFTLDLSSKDEIGDLARMFQDMAGQRREAERLKDRLYANVTAANQELEAFSYSVSHDLRAPLRTIDGFSQELLANCDSLDDRGKSDLLRIRAATQRMAQLIDDLLEFAHLSRRQLSRQPIDISAKVRDIIETLQTAEPSRRVDCTIAPNLTAEGDPRLVQIALSNLVQNAWKFTQRQCPSKIEVGVSDFGERRPFYIKDNGVGFNMAYADKLFKPFQRLHDASDFPGTGIGLAMVHRIVQRHGGQIWTQAEENMGATFYFTLT